MGKCRSRLSGWAVLSLFLACFGLSRSAAAQPCPGVIVSSSSDIVEIKVLRASCTQTFSFVRSSTTLDGIGSYSLAQTGGGSVSVISRVGAGQKLKGMQGQLMYAAPEQICFEDPFCNEQDKRHGAGDGEYAQPGQPSSKDPESAPINGSCQYCYAEYSYQIVGHLSRYRAQDGLETALIGIEPLDAEPGMIMIATLRYGEAGIESEFSCLSAPDGSFEEWLTAFELKNGFDIYEQVWEFGWESSGCQLNEQECLTPYIGAGDYYSLDQPDDSVSSNRPEGDLKREKAEEFAVLKRLVKRAQRSRSVTEQRRLLLRIAKNLNSLGQKNGADYLLKAGEIARKAARRDMKERQLKKRVWLALHAVIGKNKGKEQEREDLSGI